MSHRYATAPGVSHKYATAPDVYHRYATAPDVYHKYATAPDVYYKYAIALDEKTLAHEEIFFRKWWPKSLTNKPPLWKFRSKGPWKTGLCTTKSKPLRAQNVLVTSLAPKTQNALTCPPKQVNESALPMRQGHENGLPHSESAQASLCVARVHRRLGMTTNPKSMAAQILGES